MNTPPNLTFEGEAVIIFPLFVRCISRLTSTLRQMTALGKSPCRLRVKTTLLYTCRNRPIPAVPDRLLISYIDPPNQMKNNLTLSLGLMDSVKHIQAGKAVYSRKVIAYE